MNNFVGTNADTAFCKKVKIEKMSVTAFFLGAAELRHRIKCNSNGGHFEIQDGCHNRDLKISKHWFPTLVLHISYKNAKISKSPKKFPTKINFRT